MLLSLPPRSAHKMTMKRKGHKLCACCGRPQGGQRALVINVNLFKLYGLGGIPLGISDIFFANFSIYDGISMF